MNGNMLYTQRKYSAALDKLEQANALMPDHYTMLHLRGMCKAELEQYQDAISDLTGRAHYCNALFSRGMCHMNLGNHEKAFDDMLRAGILDSKVGETWCGAMAFVAAIDPDNPQVQNTAGIRAALERRKMSSLNVRLLLYVLPCCLVLRQNICKAAQNQQRLAFWFCLTRKEKFTLFSDHNGSLLRRQPGAFCLTTLRFLLHATIPVHH